jgi:hypothetical protein
MNTEIKEYIDSRMEDMVVVRCHSYFKTMEKYLADTNKNVIAILAIVNKIMK